jgi:hypothetical protein
MKIEERVGFFQKSRAPPLFYVTKTANNKALAVTAMAMGELPPPTA